MQMSRGQSTIGLDKKSVCSLPSPVQSEPIGRQISGLSENSSSTFEWWIHKFSRSSNRSRFELEKIGEKGPSSVS